MARLKVKQLLSNLEYDDTTNQLYVSGSNTNAPDFVVKGAAYISSSLASSGSLTIEGIDTFGDSGSFDTIDLGDY